MSVVDQSAPGIYRELVREEPDVEFRTGTPVFVGLVHPEAEVHGEAIALGRPAHLRQRVDRLLEGSYLEAAVQGFFDNGGQRCFVLPIRSPTASLVELTSAAVHERLVASLRAIEDMTEIDLVAFPDLMLPLKAGGADARARDEGWATLIASQVELVANSRATGHRLAILDSPPAMAVRRSPSTASIAAD